MCQMQIVIVLLEYKVEGVDSLVPYLFLFWVSLYPKGHLLFICTLCASAFYLVEYLQCFSRVW